jgi:hypothetical protein
MDDISHNMKTKATKASLNFSRPKFSALWAPEFETILIVARAVLILNPQAATMHPSKTKGLAIDVVNCLTAMRLFIDCRFCLVTRSDTARGSGPARGTSLLFRPN